MNAVNQRRQVRYRGHVQGVGFRYTTVGIARRFAIAGYVRNLPDGQVEIVAEGTPAELDAFLAEVSAQMQDHIREARQDTLAASGEFAGFEIRY